MDARFLAEMQTLRPLGNRCLDADGKFHGIVTFRKALEHSYNIPAIRVAQMVGLRNVIETAHRLGVRENLSAYPSLALGAFEVSLIELTSAYSVFADQGLAFPPYLIERNTMAEAHGLTLPDEPPHLLYSARLDVRTWWPKVDRPR